MNVCVPELVNSTPSKVILAVSALPIATTAAPAAVSVPTVESVIAPVPAVELIVKLPNALVAPTVPLIAAAPLPLVRVKL